MALEPFETAEAEELPGIRQLSVFLENRVGELLRLTRTLEGVDVSILALSVVNSVDCAVIRLLVDDPDEARRVLTGARFAVSEAELLVVLLPPGRRAIVTICSALLGAEVNILYAYPLLTHPDGKAALAINTDNLPMAVELLRARKFTVLDESHLRQGD